MVLKENPEINNLLDDMHINDPQAIMSKLEAQLNDPD